ncbi:MAG: ATP-binding protein [Planctomycetota bacterium]|nr:ATP-binding protein [Planctomycetota bacterium]
MKSGSISFQPRARLLKIIGEELISDEVVAIVELVKNAYDADATRVTIDFLLNDDNESIIEIRDDGHGMNLDLLLSGWMHPAGSSKRGDGPRRTQKGRRLLGEKGVGRFAADKLGRRLEIISRAPRFKEISASFNWDLFDDDEAMLSDISNQWEERSRFQEIRDHGTVLRITGLRDRWTERMYRKVVLKLARLRSPSSEHGGFDIEIRSDIFPDYSGEMNRDFLQASPYSIEAEYDGSGEISFTLKGQKLIRTPWSGGGGIPGCGPVKIRLYGYDLDTSSIARVGPVTETRAWLRLWSGISMFRDGYRVYPYGEPNDDWLRLDQRRVNNPVVRMSNNQVVGFVEIRRDYNPELLDKTNREGLQANSKFEDLRRLVHTVLQLMEAERQVHRGATRNASTTQISATPSVDALELIEQMANGTTKPSRTALRKALIILQEKERNASGNHQGLADLAGTGVVARSMLRDVSQEFDALQEDMNEVKTFLAGHRSRPASTALRAMEDSVRQLLSRLDGSGLIEASGNRGSVDIQVEARKCRDEVLHARLEDKNLRCKIHLKGGDLPRVHLPVLTIRRALFIIIENAIEASKQHGVIEIILQTDGNKVLIKVRDHGRGIPKKDQGHVFNAGFSRKGQSGMGLTVAKTILEATGGQIRIATSKQQKRGTTVEVLLPRKLSRATRVDR